MMAWRGKEPERQAPTLGNNYGNEVAARPENGIDRRTAELRGLAMNAGPLLDSTAGLNRRPWEEEAPMPSECQSGARCFDEAREDRSPVQKIAAPADELQAAREARDLLNRLAAEGKIRIVADAGSGEFDTDLVIRRPVTRTVTDWEKL